MRVIAHLQPPLSYYNNDLKFFHLDYDSIYKYIYMVELHQLVTVGKKIWFWNFWDLDTKWPGHLWLIIEH